jgi:chromosome segregation ATPase
MGARDKILFWRSKKNAAEPEEELGEILGEIVLNEANKLRIERHEFYRRLVQDEADAQGLMRALIKELETSLNGTRGLEQVIRQLKAEISEVRARKDNRTAQEYQREINDPKWDQSKKIEEYDDMIKGLVKNISLLERAAEESKHELENNESEVQTLKHRNEIQRKEMQRAHEIHERAQSSLQENHNAEKARLQEALDAKREAVQRLQKEKDRMQNKHDSEQRQMRKEFDEKEDRLKREFEARMVEMKQEQKQMRKEFDEEEDRLKRESEAKMVKMEQEHNFEQKRMRKEFGEKEARLKREFEAKMVKMMQEHNFEQKRLKDEFEAKKTQLGTARAAETKRLRRDIEAYSEDLLARDDFEPMPDNEIKARFLDLAQEIDTLARLEWKPNQKEWISQVLRHLPGNQRLLKKQILQDSVWVILHKNIFCSPFRVFGEEGWPLESQWSDEYRKGWSSGTLAPCLL